MRLMMDGYETLPDGGGLLPAACWAWPQLLHLLLLFLLLLLLLLLLQPTW
jgi:hypothetical protein